MATGDIALHAGNRTEPSARQLIVNDFSIQVATVNGSGSQSANNILLKSIFAMGVPVSGKNLFPSNIAGLPTWYTIRASRRGYVARKKEIDILVAMNPETSREDMLNLSSGGAAIYEESANLAQFRPQLNDPIACYPVPFEKLTAAVCPEAKLRKLVKNMVYVGVLAQLLNLDLAIVEASLRRQFAKKQKAAELNWAAVKAGYEYAAATFIKHDPFVLEPIPQAAIPESDSRISIEGNAAAALGCMFAGVSVVTWYPITPSSSVVENLIEYLKKYRIEPDGKATFAVVQAEDELAAIGMVLGAGWAGARSMTATSGPGISLMAEFAGYGYYAEVPGVIFDIQRVGPSTGMPTRTMQGDILSTAYLSHGDTKHILLFPGSVEECYEFAMEAFDLAEQLQTPIFVLSDLDLGMNNWMSRPFTYPERPLQRGKLLGAEELTQLATRGETFYRYRDVDGDAIPYRTLPGTDHPSAAYFTRGSGHNDKGLYTERPEEYQATMERLARKFETARQFVPAPVIVQSGRSSVGIIAFGSTGFAIDEARDQLRDEYRFETDYLRLRAFPFAKAVHEFVAAHDRVYVVEQNRDAQMLSLLKLDLPAAEVVKLRSIRHWNGLPIDARSVTDEFVLQEQL